MTTTTAVDQKLITADELLLMPKIDGRRFELIRGVLIEKMPGGDPHSEATIMTGIVVGNYVIANDYGDIRAGEPGYRLDRDPDTVRAPDVAWFAPGRLIRGNPGFPEIVPDLAIEIKSPSNSWPEIAAKAYMWLSYGAQQAWVADPPTATITIYRLDAPPQTLTENDTLDGGDLLPNFAVPVWQLFRRHR